MDHIFKFKDFDILQKDNQMKVSTDGILLGAWCDTDECRKILDIGTGTGVIAMIIARKNQNAEIDAIEIDELAYLEAQHNADQSANGGRINVIKGSIQAYAQDADVQYDHIVCNPPFFSGGTLTSNQDKDAVRHTVKLGHGDLLIAVSKLLQENGYFSLILPFMEGLRFIEMAARYKLIVADKVNIKTTAGDSTDRILVRLKKSTAPCDFEEQELVLKNMDGTYSSGFIALTKEFYL